MTSTWVRDHNGIPALFLDDEITAPITAYVGPRFVRSFVEAGIRLYTFTVPGVWWIGPDRYNFDDIDAFLVDYVAQIPGCYFMPRIYLAYQGFPWWGDVHPDEMNVLRDGETGDVRDQLVSDPEVVHYLGHEVHLENMNLHSFHSLVWRAEAAKAVSALVAHCEAAPYADQIWGWHLCDGLFQEWFHWNEYAFGGLADYSPAAQADFRRWLRRTYQNDAGQLMRAWGREVDFNTVTIPDPQERAHPTHGEFYDPQFDRPTIDYMQCFSETTVDSIIAICRAVKLALPKPKATCVFYGYQFSDMPRPQLNAHYALSRLLASPDVDCIASPHAYSNRGLGGYHAPQAVADAIRRAGKLHFDEIDCKTLWTPASVTWKRHISQPTTLSDTIELLKKDAAYQLSSATAQWWMDLTNEGWFDAPEVVEPLRRLKGIEERLCSVPRHVFGEIALIVSQRAMMFQAPKAGLHNVTQLIFRNWHLGRIGAPFEQLLLEDLERIDLPPYKLYIMANAFYLSAEQRAVVERVVKRNGATVLWIYAPGFLDDHSASLANMEALTGIRFGLEDVEAELNVSITDFDHPITRGLPPGYAYGTGIDRDQYLRPPKIEYLPDTHISPAFFADDLEARVLGVAQSTQRPGLVIKDMGAWRSVYSAAPLLSWQLMRNIARDAGVHIYAEHGDMLWGNNAFLAIYAYTPGVRTLRFPRPVTVIDAYEGGVLGTRVETITLSLKQWETQLLLIE